MADASRGRRIRARGLLGAVGSLLAPFWHVTLLASGLGMLSGFATAWLLASINRALHAGDGLDAELLLRFAGLCLLAVGGRVVAGVGNSTVGQRAIAALRKDIAGAIVHVPIAAIEKHRPHRLLSVLNNDIDTVSAFTFNVSGYAIALAIVLGSMAYLVSLSPIVFALVLAATGLGIAINIGAKRSWIVHYEGVRDAQDDLQRQYRAIIEGSKELRLNADRATRVHGLLLSGAADRIASLKTRAMRLFWIADAAGAAIFFLVIGMLLVFHDRFGIASSTMTGAVLVLLYVKGPAEQVANALPVFDQARVAFRRIARLLDELAEDEADGEPNGAAPAFARAIALHDVTYSFDRARTEEDETRAFALGPISLEVVRGETVFIVGENGSGKTTLVKLLLGLYPPAAGTLTLDGTAIGPKERGGFRQLFSAVFSDNFLFDDLLVPDEADVPLATDTLRQLGLADHVVIRDGRFSTTDLSSGQRKRLALVHALLERRPIMMFDEWAADQDPSFRRVFYENLLPGLKRRGKTLIVVSHDDRFFGAADRIVRLRDGLLVEDADAISCGDDKKFG